MENLVTWTLFIGSMELNLEKYEFIILVFFQVGILDTSRYSTWKHREIQGTTQRWESFLTNQKTSGQVTFIFRVDEIELGKIRNYFYRILPSRNSRYFELFDLEREK